MPTLNLRNNHRTAPATWGWWESQGDDKLKSPLNYGDHCCYHHGLEKLGCSCSADFADSPSPQGTACPGGLTCSACTQPPLSWGWLFSGLSLKQALSVGPNPALSKNPCVSLKQGIERAAVRAAQPIAGWLGLAGPRDFLKPSYFLFLRLAPSKPPGHRAQSCYTSQPIPWLQARSGGGSAISAGPRDAQHGPLVSS